MLPINLVYIVGMGHSGSTLLDLILGSHPDFFSIGEVDFLDKWLIENKICTCTSPINECAMWGEVITNLRTNNNYLSPETFSTTIWWEQKTRLERFRYLISAAGFEWLPPKMTFFISRAIAPEVTQRVQNIYKLFDAIRFVSQKQVLVDSSKSYRRMIALYAFAPDKMKMIWVAKDGRGWVASRMRQTGESIEVASKKWLDGHQKIVKILSRFPKNSYQLVNYESICRETDDTIKNIMNFLGFSFTPSMLDFRQVVHHNINGNPMRMSSGGIQEDLRWRVALSKDELGVFERIAGQLNRDILAQWYVE